MSDLQPLLNCNDYSDGNASDSLGFEPLINQKQSENERIPFSATGDYSNSHELIINIDSNESITKVNISGMTCQSCVRSIEDTISKKPGILKITVSLPERNATIIYDPGQVTPNDICEYIDDMGFEASLPLIDGKQATSECIVGIEGMTCNSCVNSIEGMLSTKSGIESIRVDLKEKQGYVMFHPNKVTPEEIAEQIEDMGFDAFVKSVNGKSVQKESQLNGNFVNSSNLSKQSYAKGGKGDNQQNFERCNLHVKGMTCGSCVAAIEKHVQKIPGCHKVLVSLLAARAEVQYDPSITTPQEIATSITDLGFPSSVLQQTGVGEAEVDVEISGMTCSSCVHKIESNISKLPGVVSSKVALTTHRGKFRFDPELTGARNIIEAINRLGFEAKLFTRESNSNYLQQKEEIRKWKRSCFL